MTLRRLWSPAFPRARRPAHLAGLPLVSRDAADAARAEAQRLLADPDRLTQWERGFVRSIAAATGPLSVRQAAKLAEVRCRVDAKIARAWGG